MGDASRRLLELRPATFRYKQPQTGGSHPLQYGLIAEEVAEVYPELVQYERAELAARLARLEALAGAAPR